MTQAASTLDAYDGFLALLEDDDKRADGFFADAMKIIGK